MITIYKLRDVRRNIFTKNAFTKEKAEQLLTDNVSGKRGHNLEIVVWKINVKVVDYVSDGVIGFYRVITPKPPKRKPVGELDEYGDEKEILV